ncbi:hypothetical protein [Bacillus xiamenensis]|nr:hypothetical protein [Bacillus xiamenensis]
MSFQSALEDVLEDRISHEELKDIFTEFCMILTDDSYSNSDIGKRFKQVFSKRVADKYLK